MLRSSLKNIMIMALVVLAACAPAENAPTATPRAIIITTTPVPTIVVPPTPVPSPTVALIAGAVTGGIDGVYVRKDPGTMSDIIRTINASAVYTVIGRTTDGTWLQVSFDDGVKGWIVASAAVGNFDLNTVTTSGTADNRPMVTVLPPTVGDSYPLRQRPDENAGVAITLIPPVPLQVVGRLDDNTWVQVQTGDGTQGWVQAAVLDINFPVASAAVVRPPDPTATPEYVVQGVVSERAGGLRLRQFPSTEGLVLFNLRAGTTLKVKGITSDNAWMLVKIPEGYDGWVASEYVELPPDVPAVPIITNPEAVPYVELSPPPNAPSVVSGIGGGARAIYQRGQALGNHTNVFTKVGDSLTDTPYFLRQFVSSYDLHDYGYLLPVLQYFSAGTAFDGNSFISMSRAAHASWSTFSTIDPATADPSVCQPGEIPVACEYRVVKPALALIMIGTNDAPAFPAAQYEANMRQIVETSIQMGVVPVLSTLPPRTEFNDKIIEYNQVIVALSQTYNVPLWDLYSALVNLPNRGLDGDGVHLSIPPNAPASTTDFSGDNLAYGTTMRNLTALQILDQVWRQVMY